MNSNNLGQAQQKLQKYPQGTQQSLQQQQMYKQLAQQQLERQMKQNQSKTETQNEIQKLQGNKQINTIENNGVGKFSKEQQPKQEEKSLAGSKRQSSGAQKGNTKAKGKEKKKKKRKRKGESSDDDDDDDDDGDEEDDEDLEEFEEAQAEGGWQDGEGEPCPSCKRPYNVSEFWIACDKCETWYCGKCAKMTEAKSKQTDHWYCDACQNK